MTLNNDKQFHKELLRKAIHLSSLWIPAAVYFIPRSILLPFFLIIWCGDLILEYGCYKRYAWARRTFGAIFYKTLRAKETTHEHFQVSGSVYVLTAAILCLCLFDKTVAAIGLTVMLVSDSAAALVGRSIGKTKIYKNKTLAGTFAFFISALIICILFSPLYKFGYAGILACIAATLAELFEDKIKIDDNIAIPLIIGIILSVL